MPNNIYYLLLIVLVGLLLLSVIEGFNLSEKMARTGSFKLGWFQLGLTWLHEMSHLLTAKLFGLDANFSDLHVHSEVDETGEMGSISLGFFENGQGFVYRVGRFLTGLAPFIIGFTIFSLINTFVFEGLNNIVVIILSLILGLLLTGISCLSPSDLINTTGTYIASGIWIFILVSFNTTVVTSLGFLQNGTGAIVTIIISVLSLVFLGFLSNRLSQVLIYVPFFIMSFGLSVFLPLILQNMVTFLIYLIISQVLLSVFSYLKHRDLFPRLKTIGNPFKTSKTEDNNDMFEKFEENEYEENY